MIETKDVIYYKKHFTYNRINNLVRDLSSKRPGMVLSVALPQAVINLFNEKLGSADYKSLWGCEVISFEEVLAKGFQNDPVYQRTKRYIEGDGILPDYELVAFTFILEEGELGRIYMHEVMYGILEDVYGKNTDI